MKELLSIVGSHEKLSSGTIAKALTLQLLSVPYQSLYGTSGDFSRLPINVLLDSKIQADDLNRHVLSRFLDAVDEYGPERLYVKCAQAACSKLGIDISEVHIDTTSFHYDGQTRVEEGCDLILNKGYSRDHRPYLNKVGVLAIADGRSKIPIN